LETWKKNQEFKKNWLKNQNIQYLFVVVPDKQSIHPEYLPDYLNKVRNRTRFDQLLEYMNENSDVNILDLRVPLLEAKKTDIIYWDRDSHWNYKGAYIAYRSIMERLTEWFSLEKIKEFNPSDYEIDSEFQEWKSCGMDTTLGLFLPPISGKHL
jgi:hypothetical protein